MYTGWYTELASYSFNILTFSASLDIILNILYIYNEYNEHKILSLHSCQNQQKPSYTLYKCKIMQTSLHVIYSD